MNIAICPVNCEEHLLPRFNRNIVCTDERDDWNPVSALLIKFIFINDLFAYLLTPSSWEWDVVLLDNVYKGLKKAFKSTKRWQRTTPHLGAL